MLETAVRPHRLVERVAAGMAEGRMAEIVRERQGLGEIVVEMQRPRDRARDLRHFERMRQPRPVMVAFVIDEHLRLVLQASECGGVNHAVAVALERRSRRAFWLRVAPSTAAVGSASIRRERRGIGHLRANVTCLRVLAMLTPGSNFGVDLTPGEHA